jgi:signal peptidase I
MGLNIRIHNIKTPNDFKLSYRVSPTAGDVNVIENDYILYGQYEDSVSRDYTSNPIILSGSTFDTIFSENIWVKIQDIVTNNYIIENIKVHSESYYSPCIPVCDFSDGSAVVTIIIYCDFSGGSASATIFL